VKILLDDPDEWTKQNDFWRLYRFMQWAIYEFHVINELRKETKYEITIAQLK